MRATAQNEIGNKIGLLHFSTAGSVDDGKSTLIGRLLFDSKSIFEDQLEALQRSADLTGGGELNLANLTDGLRAEREQGITIDVAYRYFATPNRKFIVADTPGHIQYTRNMVTGASTAQVSIILIDARKGVKEQTRRHAFISSLLRVPNIVVCVNKMDLVDFSEDTFHEVRSEFVKFSANLSFREISFIPVSALLGDNIVDPSGSMPWYQGPTLLKYLEEINITEEDLGEARFPVQYVLRPNSDEHRDFRGLAGKITAGSFKVGDSVVILPSKKQSRISEIHTFDGNLMAAHAPQSVSLLLEDDIDVSRGDLVVHPNYLPHVTNEFNAMICWMHELPLQIGQKFGIKHLTNSTRCQVTELSHKIDISTLEPESKSSLLQLNDIGRIKIRTMAPLTFDHYARNRSTGGFILVDETTNATLAAGMICAEE